MARIPHFSAAVFVVVAGCGTEPVIEGFYRDDSIVVASTCGDVATVPVRTTVRLQDEDIVINLAAATFSRDSASTAPVRLDTTSEITRHDEDNAFCGVVGANEVVGDVKGIGTVSGSVIEPTPSSPPPRPGHQRHETLERLPSSMNELRLRQTLRFEDVDVCVDGRLPTVPPRDCELTRIIVLRLQEACPAERQRSVPGRLGEFIFCSLEDDA